MKLFMVIRFFTDITATVGPLPYGMEECTIRAAEFQANARAEAQVESVLYKGRKLTHDDVSVVCEEHWERPALTDSK